MPDSEVITPKIIHQTWKTPELPDRFASYQKTWQTLHPDWEYRMWTDEDNLRLVHDAYPEYAEFYETLPYPILKVEFSKLFYLYSFGGLYVDLDFEALRPLDEILTDGQIVMGREIGGLGGITRGREYIMNALICSPPRHSFWELVLEEAVARFRRKKWWELYEKYIIDRVIDIIDNRAIEYAASHDDMTIVDHEVFYPSPQSERCPDIRRQLGRSLNSYAVHHYDDSWFSPLLKRATSVRYSLTRSLSR